MFRSAPRRHRSGNVPAAAGTNAAAPSTPVNGFSSRIPATLQQVFLSSNRGNDVDKPPPMKVANRAFRTLWSKTFKSKTSAAAPATPTPATYKSDKESKLDTVTAVAVEVEEEEEQSPQDFLDALLLQRGYPITRYATLQTGFYCKPTALQQSSYSRYLIDLIKANDAKKFQACMVSGLSTNPCNTFGESLLHMVCRRGDANLLAIMLDAGTDLHAADDYGRTPLHDACWAPRLCEDVLHMLLKHNPANVSMFFMQDARGSLPLSYVRREHWADWIMFLDRDKDMLWPMTLEQEDALTLPLLHQGPHSRVMTHPHNALTLELASMVANGRLAPEEAAMLKADTDDGTVEESFSHDDDESDDESDYSDSDSDGYSDDDDDDEILLEGLVGMLNQPKQ